MSIAKRKSVRVVALMLALLGSGLGAVALRAWADAPQGEREAAAVGEKKANPIKPKNAEDKKGEAKGADAKPGPGTVTPHPVLDGVVEDFAGFDDARTTFKEAMDHLADVHHFTWKINLKAFDSEDLKDLEGVLVADPKPVRPMKNVPLKMILQELLAKVPVSSGATYVLRGNVLEFTTNKAVRAEVGHKSDRLLLPLVQLEFDEVPLKRALKEVATVSGVSVILDVRAADKGKTAVTAAFRNVPTDTALAILADMADLRVVQLDSALYVTTPENARRLEADQRKKVRKRPIAPKGEEQQSKEEAK